jgi:hypothetical protein
MKFISGLFKFIAIFLMIAFVFVLPVTLLMQGVGSLLLSPGKLVDLLEENLINEEVIASFMEYEFNQLQAQTQAGEGQDENAFSRILLEGLGNLDHDQWVELTLLLAPPQLIEQSLDGILSGYYEWVENSSEVPQITLDLAPWKSNLKTNLVPAIELLMYTLPECSPEQQQVFLEGGELAANAPSCRPAEPVYGLFMEQAGTSVPALIDDMADEYDFGKQLADNQQMDWAGFKDTLGRIASVTQSSWVAMLVIFVIAIPMGARSFSGVFNWAGWPIFLSGILTLLLSLLLIMIAQGALTQLNPVADLTQSTPSEISRPLARLFSDGFRYIARPLLLEGAALILMGGVGIIIGIVIASRSKQMGDTSGDLASHPVPAGAQTPVLGQTLGPDETIQLTEEELDQPPEDEDRPSGMFG